MSLFAKLNRAKTYRAMVKCDICGKEVAKTGMTAHKKTHENREEKEQLFLARRLAIGEKLGCLSKLRFCFI